MSCRRILLIGSLCLALVGSASADDRLVVTFIDEYVNHCSSIDLIEAFEIQYVYVAVHQPSRPVASISFGVDIETSGSYFGGFAPAEGWVSSGEGDTFVLECTGEPSQDEFLILAVMPLVVVSSEELIEFYLRFPDGADHFEYLDGDGTPVPLWSMSDPTEPSALANPDYYVWINCYVPNEASAWGTVKSLYR